MNASGIKCNGQRALGRQWSRSNHREDSTRTMSRLSGTCGMRKWWIQGCKAQSRCLFVRTLMSEARDWRMAQCKEHMWLNQEESTIGDLDGMPLPSSFAKTDPEYQLIGRERRWSRAYWLRNHPIIQWYVIIFKVLSIWAFLFVFPEKKDIWMMLLVSNNKYLFR